MVKYFSNDTDIQNAWEHVVSAFWRRYPNPFRYSNSLVFNVLLFTKLGYAKNKNDREQIEISN